jgi:GntR family transcriptional regulator
VIKAPVWCASTGRGRFVLPRPTLRRAVAARIDTYLDTAERDCTDSLIVMDAPEIDYRAELPPHRQIAAWVLARIESGDLQAGQPVPSEKELMDLFGVARTTARRAIAWLREQGAIRTVPGRGSYVTDRG